MTSASDQIPQIFDADNHYWETSDAFTRHRAPEFAERGVRLVDIDGKPRYVFDGGRLPPIIPGPGDVHGRPRPGALYDYFAGTSDKARLGDELSCEDPAEHPEWFDRLVIMETGPFTGHQKMSDAWLAFRDFVRNAEEVPVGMLIRGGCKHDPGDAVIAAYEAPYVDPAAKAGA